jgi:hypothetical protein
MVSRRRGLVHRGAVRRQSLAFIRPRWAPRSRAHSRSGNLDDPWTSRGTGGMLITRDTQRTEIQAWPPGESKARDLTWLDWSLPVALSRDGRLCFGIGRGRRGRLLRVHPQDRRLTRRAPRRGKRAGPLAGRRVGARDHPYGDRPAARRATRRAPASRGFFPRTASRSSTRSSCRTESRSSSRAASRDADRASISATIAGGKARALTPEGYAGILVAPDGKSALDARPGPQEIHVSDRGWRTHRGLQYERRRKRPSMESRRKFLYVSPGRAGPPRGAAPGARNGSPGAVEDAHADGRPPASLSSSDHRAPTARHYLISYARNLSDLYVVEGLE